MEAFEERETVAVAGGRRRGGAGWELWEWRRNIFVLDTIRLCALDEFVGVVADEDESLLEPVVIISLVYFLRDGEAVNLRCSESIFWCLDGDFVDGENDLILMTEQEVALGAPRAIHTPVIPQYILGTIQRHRIAGIVSSIAAHNLHSKQTGFDLTIVSVRLRVTACCLGAIVIELSTLALAEEYMVDSNTPMGGI